MMGNFVINLVSRMKKDTIKEIQFQRFTIETKSWLFSLENRETEGKYLH